MELIEEIKTDRSLQICYIFEHLSETSKKMIKQFSNCLEE